MSKVVLPYLLREGQVAYAARVMANFNALLDRINSVTLPGMAETDLEDAVQQLKLLLDKNAATLQQTLAGFFYDGQNQHNERNTGLPQRTDGTGPGARLYRYG